VMIATFPSSLIISFLLIDFRFLVPDSVQRTADQL
jgi:hypothetical protein